MRHRYRVVDVFTSHALEGNPLAVFPEASRIDERTMQKIAREMNLSETIFVLASTRPACCAQVRIFTPNQEMSFAGHPIVGGSFVLLNEGIVPKGAERFVLDVKIGPVPVRVERGDRPLFWLTTPSIAWGQSYERNACAEVLGLRPDELLDIAPQALSTGNPNIFVAVKDKDAVDRSEVDLAALRRVKGKDAVGVFVFTPTPDGAYSRMFAPEFGVPEDPATGSATGPLAAYMMRHGLVSSAAGTRFHSEQGTKIGRRSILHVQINGDHGAGGIEVGGYVTPVAEGTMSL